MFEKLYKTIFFTLLLFLFFSATIHAENITEKTDTIREVVITGTNRVMNISNIPYSVTKVSQQQLEASGRTQLLSAITGIVPGVFITQRNIYGFGSSNGGSGSIKIRGVGGESNNSQVLMMVDGKPQFSGIFSHPVADIYRTEFVDRVEIVRGPASVLYGSNAMGGAINVITKTPREDGSHTVLKAQYGSFNTLQSSITNMTRAGKFSSVASLSYNRTDGTEKNFDFSQGAGYVKLGYDFSSNWNAYADYSLMNYSGNDPIYAKLSNPASTDVYHQNVTRGEASIVVNNSYGNTDGAVRTYFGHGRHKIEDPKPFKMTDNRIGVLAYQNFTPAENTHFTVGFDFDRYLGEIPLSGGKTREEEPLKTMGTEGITEYSPYLTASQGLWNNLLTLTAGLRMANSNRFGTQWIPQAGITLSPGSDWTLKASLAKGYRNPSFKELFLYKMANPDLEPENMMNYEMSVGKHFSRFFSFEVTGFYIRGKNLIQTLDMKNVNTGKFCNKGFELSAASQPVKNLGLRATYSFLETDINNLTGAPKHMYSLMADWKALPRLSINAGLTGVSHLFVHEDVKQQNYALLDIMATYRALDNLDIFVQGQNITDARYCINRGYTMPGATVNGGVKLSF